MQRKLQLCEKDKNASKKPQIVNPCYTFTQQYQNKFPAMDKMENTAKIVNGNGQELQPREREKMMDE